MNGYLASLGPELANHLWQSTAFALLAWLLTLALRRNQARARYTVWLTASVKFLVPFSLLISVGNLLPHQKQTIATPIYSAMDVAEEPFAMDQQIVVAPVVHLPNLRDRVEATLPVCIGSLWLLGFGTVLFAWGNRWHSLSHSVRKATPVTEGREFETLRSLEGGGKKLLPLLMSPERIEPGIFGVFRPLLVWPEQLSDHLGDHHIEAIVAHELTHVRRRDNLTALVHMLVEAAFWFNPLVWWIERQMVKEREQACDEAVVAMGGCAEVYAEGLLRTCWFCVESPLACVAGVTGADLRRRVAGIITGRAQLHMSWPKKLLLASSAVCAILTPVTLGQAKAAQRLMLAAIKVAPKPVQIAAKAVLADVSNDAVEVQISAPPATGSNDAEIPPEDVFEVATIRPASDPDCRHSCGFRLAPSGQLTVTGMPLLGLVGFSSIQRPGKGEVTGGPSWVQSEKWDITAKGEPSKISGWDQLSDEERTARIKPALLKLVIERFHVKMHTEVRPHDVYAMVPAKGGVKIGPVLKRAEPPPAHADPQQGDALARINKLPPGSYTMSDGGSWLFLAVRSDILALQIASNCQIHGMVVDQSGLQGFYDLNFKPDYGPDALPLQDQVEVQLGLKFEPKKLPIPTYVIDSAEKPSIDGAEVVPPALVVPALVVQDKSAAAGAVSQQFDAATIKHHDPNDTSRYANAQGFYGNPGGRIFFGGPVKMLVEYAYGLQDYQVTDGPEWLASERFEINAVPPDDSPSRKITIRNADPTPEQRQMLQSLLRDRFVLRCHFETKEGEVYVLTRGTKPLQLKPTENPDVDPRAIVFGALGSIEHRSNSTAASSAPAHSGPISIPDDAVALQGYNTTTDYLAVRISRYLQLPVLNQTGIEGRYDFDIPAADTVNQDMGVVVLNLVDELGLKIKRGRGPIQTLVIDHIEHPSEN